MCKIQFVLVSVLAVLVAAEARTARDVMPAGKCNTFNIEPIPLDYDKLAKLGRWRVLFITEAEPFSGIDHAFMEVTANNDNTYKMDIIRIMNDNSKLTQSYTQSVVDNVIIEDTVDENGKYKHFHTYPLAISKENGVLFYRCSDAGRVEVDTRYIVIPADIPLSKEGEKELLEADRKQNFRGKLIQLPSKLHKEA